jgi:AbrB family looped-hinge helix DNA binding protein
MEQVTVSSKGQLAIPRAVRDALNLAAGARLTLEVRGQEIVLSKEPAWKKLEGAAAGRGLMETFAAARREEREREDARS